MCWAPGTRVCAAEMGTFQKELAARLDHHTWCCAQGWDVALIKVSSKFTTMCSDAGQEWPAFPAIPTRWIT